MRRLIVVTLLALVATLAPAAKAGATPHYDLLAWLASQGQATCADVRWAAGVGLIEPVEVRWLNAAGVHCPDHSAGREGAPSDQYVVMLALNARGQLTCADLEWNASRGYLTWTALVNLWHPSCRLTNYARMVPLMWSGLLGCHDVAWHAERGFITPPQAAYLNVTVGC
jgi:hypothetical protein